MDSFEPDNETLSQEYDKRVQDLITKAQAGDQAMKMLSSDFGREVRNHIVIRKTAILNEIASLDVDEDTSKLKKLQFEYKVINGVTDILALLIVQSDEAITQFDQLQNQRG